MHQQFTAHEESVLDLRLQPYSLEPHPVLLLPPKLRLLLRLEDHCGHAIPGIKMCCYQLLEHEMETQTSDSHISHNSHHKPSQTSQDVPFLVLFRDQRKHTKPSIMSTAVSPLLTCLIHKQTSLSLQREKIEGTEAIPCKSKIVSFQFSILFSGRSLWTSYNGILMDFILGSYIYNL